MSRLYSIFNRGLGATGENCVPCFGAPLHRNDAAISVRLMKHREFPYSFFGKLAIESISSKLAAPFTLIGAQIAAV